MSISEACLLVANVHMVNEHIFANSPDRTLNRCNIWCSSVAILFKWEPVQQFFNQQNIF